MSSFIFVTDIRAMRESICDGCQCRCRDLSIFLPLQGLRIVEKLGMTGHLMKCEIK